MVGGASAPPTTVRQYPGPMQELYGDSARGTDWAAVRLRVRQGRIVDADAPGVDADLRGLTLLEACAVGGELLAVDALANALGPAVRAAPDPARVAVAMSGGVDSAVTLLKAGPAAVGVTLRLWLDPNGPNAERACCSPSAVVAARESCHARGLPHVTLDLREAFRRAVVTPFVRGYARGETPNPCIRCNGGFRFAELLSFARRVGASTLATGHYARIVERDGRLLLARGVDEHKDQSYMLARLSPRHLPRISFPLGTQTKDETRAEAAAAGLAAAQRAESQEACFLAGGDYRSFLDRHGLPESPGTIVDEAGDELGEHRGYWQFTPGQRRGLGVCGSRTAVCPLDGCTHEHRGCRAPRLARPHASLGPRPDLRTGEPGDRKASLPVACRRRDGRGDGDGISAPAGRTGLRGGQGPGSRSVRRGRRCRFGVGHVRRRGLG